MKKLGHLFSGVLCKVLASMEKKGNEYLIEVDLKSLGQVEILVLMLVW